MSRKSKIPSEKKVEFVELYLRGKMGCVQAAKEVGVAMASFQKWVMKYQSGGPTGLLNRSTNAHYSKETKLSAVVTYLSGEGSLMEVCKKFHISSTKQLSDWIMKYNAHKELKQTNGGSRMSKSRQSTPEERLEIVQYCLKNDKNYGTAAIKYNVSYQQVRNWILKYEQMGAAGLEDRRGRRVGTQASRTPEEELRNKIAELERKNRDLQMENELLKKVEELSMKDLCR